MKSVFHYNCVIFSFLSDFGICVPQENFDIIVWSLIFAVSEHKSSPFPPPFYPLSVHL
jgi:hypothetical protein